MQQTYKIGVDIGSTTVKLVVLDEEDSIVFSEYKRHLSDIKNTLIQLIKNCFKKLGNIQLQISITGSGGLSISEWMNIKFIQEVIACAKAVETFIPITDVVIELGGEDAKITYFKGGMEQRMNGSCAGGTGAFIDQMAVLLNTDAAGLNEYAKGYKVIYPIASRCGVFAKTDIQPLINDGARKEDIAASIFQAVVNQTIGGLACGKPIRGKVAFLGGPLYFLSELRQRFIESLKLKDEDAMIPKHSQLFVAIGAALSSEEENQISLKELVNQVEGIKDLSEKEVGRLQPLFKNKEEYQLFLNRHKRFLVKRGSLSNYKGRTYLGIDAGSTTTKVALIGEDDELLYSYYGSNEGNPLKKIISLLIELYDKFPLEATLSKCTVTGYGEALIKAALHVDIGEIETVAHYKAAQYFLPGVDFILDIGGQDMKCLRIKKGAIDSILLNEACSSGCGSFLEGFASSLNMTVDEFAQEALYSSAPVDLGTKCTVFMNSKVKQAQKEGAKISDLSAGLSYSVIKNALYKVIKIRDENDIGRKIIVQGGTFYNDAVLRSFELISGKEAVRPEIAGLMGAYGAALIAKERYQEGETTSLLSKELLSEFHTESSNRRCKKCLNQCLLTINKFSTGESFITGNRCEKGLELEKSKTEKLPNLYEYKYRRTFCYKPLAPNEAKRGVIGIPRVLNMYENYPFWFTLLTKLGFSVFLSSPSGKKIYEKGLETIPSESVCYPAKLCHGHIMDLLDKGVKTIFYPCVVYEKTEYKDVNDHYNCPVVISYPEVIKCNVDEIKKNNVKLISPFLSLDNEKVLTKRIIEEFKEFQVTLREAKMAVLAAFKEREEYKKDIRQKGEETISYLKKNKKKGIVLCGKPYHIDPEINHGISDLITSYGMAVLTEDSISHLAVLKHKLRVVDQWVYNSRLYRAAAFVAEESYLELIQLNSFGCGLDSVTTDQISELLATGGKMYTMLKIDEGNNLGAAKIRIRSLKAAMEERERNTYQLEKENISYGNQIFTKEMRKYHTILAPQMAPYHFELLQEAARTCGYKMEFLPAMDPSAVAEGLKYVNNDACYPAIIVIGQMIKALKSGKYDLNHTTVIISQTGGGCRATNYIAYLKLALKKAGFEKVPIISLNVAGLEKQPGFSLSIRFINRSIMALIYGDLFMKALFRTRPYEKVPGSAQLLYEKWNLKAKDNIRNGSRRIFNSNIRNIIHEFESLEIIDIKKPKVGIVGEIYLKYNPTANNDIVSILEQGGAEAVIPDLTDFILYCTFNSKFKYKYLAGEKYTMKICDFATSYIMKYRNVVKKEMDQSLRFLPMEKIDKLAKMVSPIISLGNQTGEGWLIAAEMLEFMNQGINNIVCVQPLACLPNHAMGKGVIKPLKEKFPEANIIPIDYDPGISKVNQLNRIKLMLSVAEKNLKKE
ncbi:2-hydroxyacyl-CoA dehydratase [Anaerosacchariphilus polymeriproducens]|uniref:2-hydroxyglutaryl-CoA dehydratase n=1 Tax=Anaerosacchariphilus polymeriproducens TaxID=1812858 RepID=A0A371AZD0_9FIRM|nr:2-hydroxyacyl-CoA dehydratase [Anaerosacchariphilus polymeriproducens]RDU24955.1 2-hydroxyglutaryl-CoA dehydratase [Anaerosacchariphilus polymeriproducens]